MPCVLHLVVGRARRGRELILPEEVQPPLLLLVDADPQLVHVVECREKGRRDVRELVNVSFVLHDRILQGLQNAALRDVANAARLHHADREIGDPVLLVVDRLTQLERQ